MAYSCGKRFGNTYWKKYEEVYTRLFYAVLSEIAQKLETPEMFK